MSQLWVKMPHYGVQLKNELCHSQIEFESGLKLCFIQKSIELPLFCVFYSRALWCFPA